MRPIAIITIGFDLQIIFFVGAMPAQLQFVAHGAIISLSAINRFFPIQKIEKPAERIEAIQGEGMNQCIPSGLDFSGTGDDLEGMHAAELVGEVVPFAIGRHQALPVNTYPSGCCNHTVDIEIPFWRFVIDADFSIGTQHQRREVMRLVIEKKSVAGTAVINRPDRPLRSAAPEKTDQAVATAYRRNLKSVIRRFIETLVDLIHRGIDQIMELILRRQRPFSEKMF